MSLTNEMLKDLEKRQAKQGNFQPITANLESAELPPKNPLIYVVIALSILLVIVIALFAIKYLPPLFTKNKPQHTQHTKTLAKKHPTQTKATAVSAAPIAQPMIPAVPVMPAATAVAVTPAELQVINIDGDRSQTNIRFVLNSAARYQMNSQQNQLEVIFYNTQIAKNCAAIQNMNTPAVPQNFCGAPILAEGSSTLISDAHVTQQNNNTVIQFTLVPNAIVQHFNYQTQAAPPELDITLSNSKNSTGNSPLDAPLLPSSNTAANINDGPTQMTVKPASPESLDDKVTQNYQISLDLIAQGQVDNAMNKLQNILLITPQYQQARITLATLLLQRGLTASAKKVLTAGLALQPNNIQFIQLLARAYIGENNYQQARDTLLKASDIASTDPNYLALLATIYQHLGSAAEAAKLYQQLIHQDPNNPRWLTGLGLTLEQQGMKNEALQAYQKASSNNPPPQLQALIANKIANLEGVK